MPQCQHFVQNAWKKDLCSNCFKSKEEHSANGVTDGRSRYLATMIPVPKATTQAAKGILRDVLKPSRHPKGTRVVFPPEESQVIGFGGEECILSDDEDDDNMSPVPAPVEETPCDGEQEREMQRITRSNTDFNTVAANLLGTAVGEPKRSFTQLMLGKPLTDAEGRKKTLLVMVQPFGGPEGVEPSTPVANNRKASITKVGNETSDKKSVIKSTEDSTDPVVLKSIVRNGVAETDVIKLDVKISDVKQNDNKEEIVGKQRTEEKNLVIKSEDLLQKLSDAKSIPKEEVSITTVKSVVKDEETPSKNEVSINFIESKTLGNLTPKIMKDNDDCEEKTSKIPLIRSRVNTERTKTVIRTAAFKGRADLETKLDDILPKPAMRKSYEVNNKNMEYIIQKEKSNVVLNLIIKDNKTIICDEYEHKEDLSKPEENTKKSEFLLNNKLENLADEDLSTPKFTENKVKLTNGILFELDLQPSQVPILISDTTEMKEELVKEVSDITEYEPDSKKSPMVETKNSLNTSKQIESIILMKRPEDEVVAVETPVVVSEDTPKKLPTNIYRKLPILDEKIILKEVSKTVSNTPVRKVTIVERTKETVSEDVFTVRKIEGESAAILPQECAKEEVYQATKVIVEGPHVEKNEDTVFRIEESRELAGEPDGRADSDELSEPPALPSSPPPLLDPRPSFLHGLALGIKRPLGDKPKIPMKSSKVFQATRKAFQHLTEKPTVQFNLPDVTQQESSSDPLRTPQKRRAPKPPPTQIEEANSSIFARNPTANSKSYSPISREKEKRERSSSCSPKSRVNDGVDKTEVVSTIPCPEPAPRRSLSLSVESLSSGSPPSDHEKDKKKSNGRSKFSIRKFLRLGGNKDQEDKYGFIVAKPEEVAPLAPSPKPRPEIIHPLELNGAEVEVLRSDGCNTRRSAEDSSSTSSFGSMEHRDNTTEASSDSFSSYSPNNTAGRPNKPPPPPRNQSLDAWGHATDKPARPPPPKSAEMLRKQKHPLGPVASPVVPNNNVYANLDIVAGEVRSGLTPSKPQRSASIRDAVPEGPKRKFSAAIQTPDDGTYEVVEIRQQDTKTSSFLPNPSEGVYESVRNSSPECDSTPAEVKANRYVIQQRRSEGSMDMTPDYAKFRGHFPRSTSLPYCGSDTESDIYSPYSFYGSEEGAEDEGDYATASHTWKTNRLRLRKGRSIVHKSLEDNYGAVIIANHEALAQVLEQVNQVPVVPLPLRGLKAMTNLRWSDFTISSDASGVQAGRRVFHSAQWSGQNVTLSIAVDQSRLPNKNGTFALAPLTEFNDLVPSSCLYVDDGNSPDLVQASVAVLLRLQIDTIKSYGISLRDKNDDNSNAHYKEASFVLLQLINGLKNLQAQGIEESPLNLSSFVLCRDEKDIHPRLCVLQSLGIGAGRSEEEETGSLCQCAAAALKELMPNATLITTIVKQTLAQERSVSLTQVKSLLEFSLWGPGDVALSAPVNDREQALQRWLDLERATVLHGLVRTRVELTSFEECHLLFLVRTSAKMMCEASFLFDAHRKQEISN